MESLQVTNQPVKPPTAANASTKEELLSRAKAAVEANERSLHDAAEALAIAQELHGATQREMAGAVGKSAPWVNALLKWRRSGYKDESPFGPKTKAGRVQQAEQRAVANLEMRPRGVAAADRDNRRTEGAVQLISCIEKIKNIVSASIFDNATREMFRRTHSPHLDGFIDERGKCRFEPSQSHTKNDQAA